MILVPRPFQLLDGSGVKLTMRALPADQQAPGLAHAFRPQAANTGRHGTISPSMSPQQKAESLGIAFSPQTPGYLNLCIRSGKQLITSGHVSGMKGKLGGDLTTEQGYQAARDCATRILQSVWNAHGTLDGLRVLKVLGCVNSAPEFIEQHLVINGASDLLHEVFGKQTDGYHARSALGFVSLPTGAAVEVEAIFEIT